MSIFMDLFYKIIGMTDALYDFLFTKIDLSLLGFAKDVSLWEILSGSLIVIFLIFIITKKLLL